MGWPYVLNMLHMSRFTGYSVAASRHSGDPRADPVRVPLRMGGLKASRRCQRTVAVRRIGFLAG